MWNRLTRLFRPFRPLPEDEFHSRRNSLLQQTPIPVFWLFGKTQAGKTSIIRLLTGAEDAVIGSGFRPETKFSRRYAFPSEESPLLEFLDTRGLGEVAYDPAVDVQSFSADSHLVIVPVRVTDQAVESIIEPLQAIRKSAPERSVMLVLTCLHETYPGEQHPDPDPFVNVGRTGESPLESDSADVVSNLAGPDVPESTAKMIMAQVQRFEGLIDAVVPIDLTREEDGFLQMNFGADRLRQALLDHLPDAYRQTFMTWREVADSLRDLHEAQAHPYLLSSALVAASAASVPVPWIDLPIVAGVQLDLVRRLAKVYGQTIDTQEFLTAAGLVGGPLMLRQGLREALKLIPWVGIPTNAALAFASTYGLGKAFCWYYSERQNGYAPTREEIRTVLKEQISLAEQLWKSRNEDEATQ